MTEGWLHAIGGGMLIGIASGGLMLGLGRIAGISGVFGGLVRPVPVEWRWRMAFVAGLLAAGAIAAALGAWAPPVVRQSLALVAIGGLLVGVGTTLANGCTSGHGVCGVALISPRSLVAVGTFLGSGMLVTFVLRHLAGGL